ncbi:MAG TPA: YihY/virulence factor BrkB family protein [Acidimicrobiales bacterium]|nr:YihY/virulence factor BrkB family protein [Acidimicrobiales bacterium]
MLERLRSTYSARWPWLGIALDVQRRFGEVHGGSLAASVALAGFLSLFPLVLVAIAVVGFFAANRADLTGDAISFLGLPRSGDAASVLTAAIATASESRRAASVVGFVGLVWSGLGLVGALQYLYDSVWQVQGRGIRDKVAALAWLLGAALLFVTSFAVTAGLRFVPLLAPLNLLVGLGLSTALFLWTAKVLCNRDVGWRPLVPGAVLGAVGFEVLKVLGGIYVPRAVASSSALYGSIGVVFAILAWLMIFSRLVVYSALLNVVAWERRHGTVSVELRVPKVPGRVPVAADRGGQAVAG